MAPRKGWLSMSDPSERLYTDRARPAGDHLGSAGDNTESLHSVMDARCDGEGQGAEAYPHHRARKGLAYLWVEHCVEIAQRDHQHSDLECAM